MNIIGWICVGLVVGLNIWLLIDNIIEYSAVFQWWTWIIVGVIAVAFCILIVVVSFWPLKPRVKAIIEDQKQQQQEEHEELTDTMDDSINSNNNNNDNSNGDSINNVIEDDQPINASSTLASGNDEQQGTTAAAKI